MLNKEIIDAYVAILEEELVVSSGCTEPASIAFCAAKLRDVLGERPDSIRAELSGNVLKNVKSVVVPSTGGLRGAEAAVAAGVVAGDASNGLRAIKNTDAKQQAAIREYLNFASIDVLCVESPRLLDIRLIGICGTDHATVHIANNHMNIVSIEKNGEVLLSRFFVDSPEDNMRDKSILNVKDIVEFADSVPLERITPTISRQVALNSEIAKEGLRGDWGAGVGKAMLSDFGSSPGNEAKAYAAAGSDARMSGCALPVVIISGSGNQGLTVTMPIVRFALHYQASEERLYRALALADLITIHQKSGIGRLSSFCGAICAGAGAGAGIAYLLGGGYDAVAHTVVNSLAAASGIICDGAKPSCAAKIALSVESALIGYHLYLHGHEFKCGEGIVTKGADNTIENVGTLVREGINRAEQTILKIMQDNKCR